MMTGFDAYLPFREAFVALSPDKFPPDYIDAQVWAGFWQCWSDGRAAILAEIKTYPSGLKEVHGLAAAGDLENIVALIPYAEAYGRKAGASLASIESAPGWARIMEKHGYATDQVRIVRGL